MKTSEKILENVPNKATDIKEKESKSLVLPVSKKRSHLKIFIFLTLFLLFLLCLTFSTIFAIINIDSDKIIEGVSVYGVDLSGLTVAEATETFESYITNKADKSITFTHSDFEGVVTLSQLNINFDIVNAIDEAYSIGRCGNIFEKNFSIFSTLTSPINIHPKISYDSDIFNSLIEAINQNLPDLFLDPDYYIDGSNLIIVNGKDGVITDSDALLPLLLDNLDKGLEEETSIELPVIPVEAKKIDIDAVYRGIYKKPTDAYYLTDPYVVYPSSNGLDFAISVDSAKEMIQTYQEQYTIPLQILYPNVFTNDIGIEAFPNLLSDFSTSFSSSNYARSTNIELAASKINGFVLMPGETFSFNQTVGQRTVSAGFKEAPAYSNGQVVQETGGGICQVSSTLYNAILYANLEISERTGHYFAPGYVKSGLDATVSWGGPDFKFTNNRDYPIKIVTDTSGKNVHVYIYGLQKDSDYTVELQTEYLSTIYPKTVYNYTYSLSSGKKRTTSSGSSGCKTATYKILYDKAGNFVSKTQISVDVYNAHDTVVEVGI